MSDGLVHSSDSHVETGFRPTEVLNLPGVCRLNNAEALELDTPQGTAQSTGGGDPVREVCL